jgi:hypothetical protein
MAITKCLNTVLTVSWLTVPPRELSHRGRTSDWMVNAGVMEKIMTKTPRNTKVREFAAGNALTESELDNVSGGAVLQHEETHASTTRTECHIFDDGVDLAMFCNRIPFWH